MSNSWNITLLLFNGFQHLRAKWALEYLGEMGLKLYKWPLHLFVLNILLIYESLLLWIVDCCFRVVIFICLLIYFNFQLWPPWPDDITQLHNYNKVWWNIHKNTANTLEVPEYPLMAAMHPDVHRNKYNKICKHG